MRESMRVADRSEKVFPKLYGLMATSFFEANSCPLGYFFMNVSKDSIFPNRKYILLMTLVGTLRVQQRRWQERIPHLSVAVVSICCDLRRGNWPTKGGYPNKPVIILIPKLHGIRDILFTRYPSIPFYLRFGPLLSPLSQIGDTNDVGIKVDALYDF